MSSVETGSSPEVVLVTGASSGIGRATAQAIAKEGGKVVLFARRRQLLESLADTLNAGESPQAVAVAGDVSCWEDCVAAVEAARALGELTALVNAAGAWADGPFDAIDPGELRHFVDTDVAGALQITRAALHVMKQNGRGRVLHINGLQGFLRMRGPVAYAAVESAVRGLCESLRWEAATYGVHVSLLTLGGVSMEDHPDASSLYSDGQRQLLRKSEVVAAVMFMLGQPSGVNVDELVLTPLGLRLW